MLVQQVGHRIQETLIALGQTGRLFDTTFDGENIDLSEITLNINAAGPPAAMATAKATGATGSNTPITTLSDPVDTLQLSRSSTDNPTTESTGQSRRAQLMSDGGMKFIKGTLAKIGGAGIGYAGMAACGLGAPILGVPLVLAGTGLALYGAVMAPWGIINVARGAFASGKPGTAIPEQK
jgi:hypothetical protein